MSNSLIILLWVVGVILAVGCWVRLAESRRREMTKLFAAYLRQHESKQNLQKNNPKPKADNNE
jgi:hypothetical protein